MIRICTISIRPIYLISLVFCAFVTNSLAETSADKNVLFIPPSKEWKEIEIVNPIEIAGLPDDYLSEFKKRNILLKRWKNATNSTITISVADINSVDYQDDMKHLIFGINVEMNWLYEEICKSLTESVNTIANNVPFKDSMRITELEIEYTCKRQYDEFTMKKLMSIVTTKKYVYVIELQSLKEHFDGDKTAYYKLRNSIKEVTARPHPH